jgi:uncharacterized protein
MTSPEFRPFWEATAAGDLTVQRCDDCGTRRWPPRAACARCGSESASWIKVAGCGSVYSWVVVHRTTMDSMRSRVPYTVLVVELEEEPHLRFVGGLVPEDADAELRIGLPVEAALRADEDGRTRPYWKVAADRRAHRRAARQPESSRRNRERVR